jgi:hypothetical protein
VVPKVEELGLKVLFLLIPGIIALGVMKALGPRKPRSDFEQGLQIFVYGVVCYALTGFVEGLSNLTGSTWLTANAWKTSALHAFSLATLSPDGLAAQQVAEATVIALLLGCILAVAQTHSVPHRVLRWLRLTKRIGEVDIWALALNSPDLENWITVRDHETEKVYQGWIYGYSDGGDDRELLLMDVVVYALDKTTGTLAEVDRVPTLYLGLDRKSVVIEFQRKARPSK